MKKFDGFVCIAVMVVYSCACSGQYCHVVKALPHWKSSQQSLPIWWIGLLAQNPTDIGILTVTSETVG